MKKTKTPERMCIACREMKDKKSLLRVVKTPEGELRIDLTGKQNGRGAYLCSSEECLNKAIKSKAIERALGIKPADEFVQALRKQINGNE